jgi:FG-GAP-like repeat
MSDNLLTTELSTASVLADSSLNDPNGEWVEPSGWTLRRSSESTETSTLLEEPLQEREAAWVMDAGFWTTTQAIKAPSANILWRNVSTGENRVLQIEGSQQIGTQVLPTRDLNWQIVGTSDFNRDSKDDLLWRNFKTGEVQIWALNGSNVETSVLYTINDLNWQIRGIGDFNRDGSSDIVWRNVSTGTNVVWFLKGTQFSDHLSFNPVSDTNWNITAVSDLNGDGHSDLIWNNAATGETYTWLMNGINYTIANSTQLQNELGWKIVAVQDFTGDQRPDILWHNERTGAVECWENNQATFQRRVTLQNQAPSHSQLVSTADLDADGIPDLLWQDPATGVLTRWLMNRNSVRDSATLSGFFDARWTAVAALQDTGTSSTLQSSLLSNRRIAASTATEGLQSAQMVGSSFNSSGQVNSGKLSDYYRFDTSSSGVFTATLSGLSADGAGQK